MPPRNPAPGAAILSDASEGEKCLKLLLKKIHIVFLQHRVEIRGLVKKNLMKPGEEVLAEHHCFYALVKCLLGAKPPDVDMRFSKSLRILF